MIVESFAVFSIVGTACVIISGLGHPVSLPFSAAGISLQQICEYMIILRVARGQRWEEDTVTSIHFKAREVNISMNGSQVGDGSEPDADNKPE
ncbi:hypothetical protein BD779DRAFT_1795785 [Infundibulicybe gibba]|nr:hypothetical protein BD779DRAFT_1795785 [Infundibulicybe gibba]